LRFAGCRHRVAHSAARPVTHPWLHKRPLTEIGPSTPRSLRTTNIMWTTHIGGRLRRPSWPMKNTGCLVEANERLARMIKSTTAERLMQDATTQLQARVQYVPGCAAHPSALALSERQLLSACGVIAPSAGLHLDQIGLPTNRLGIVLARWRSGSGAIGRRNPSRFARQGRNGHRFSTRSHATEVKVFETETACRDGATELDMSVNVARCSSGDWQYVEHDVRAS